MKNILLAGVVILIAGSIWYLQKDKITLVNSGQTGIDISVKPEIKLEEKVVEAPETKIKIPDNNFPPAKEITTPDGFINTLPFKLADLIGKKVILVDFWTYSCINCQRTTPYLNAWYEKYKDAGLEIVGVHTPEFEFEKNYENVKKATENAGIKFPVVLDNDYSTWQAYGNRYWPRKYLINLQGKIVYDHIGEGAYAETEKKIQEQLGILAGEMVKVKADLPTNTQISAETYFGSSRNNNFNTGLKLTGDWQIQPEFAQNKLAGDSITMPYRAKKVFFVAGADQPIEIEVKQDGKTVKTLTIQAETLYELIENAEPEVHELKIIIKSAGLRAYTFTFG